MNIQPIRKVGGSRTGTLWKTNYSQIKELLGFDANVTELDDPYKVDANWGFTVDNKFCAIWSYKGSGSRNMWSTDGDHESLKKLFGDKYEPHVIAA